MKNLFEYATKELSQDAFLMWLFNNHDDPKIGDIANALLGKFCEFQKDEKVKSLKTVPQWCKIDITVWMTTTLDRKVVLCIEDKTFSNEHNQLETYDRHIDGVKGHETYKVFYKTSTLDDEEKARIDKVNMCNKVKWKIFNLHDIVAFFIHYKDCDNLIISQYTEYVSKISNAENNTQKPISNQSKSDFIAWKSYFDKTVIPELNGNGSLYECASWKAGQYPYVVLNIKKFGFGNRNIPYLEIRSRDCCDKKFCARILCYGVLDDDLEQNQLKLIDNIKAIPDFEHKGLVTSHKGKRIYPKQVGYSKNFENIETDNRFIELVKKYIELYLKVMVDWE